MSYHGVMLHNNKRLVELSVARNKATAASISADLQLLCSCCHRCCCSYGCWCCCCERFSNALHKILLHLGFRKEYTSVDYRIKLDALQFVRHIAGILFSYIKITRACLTDQFDQDLSQLFLGCHLLLLWCCCCCCCCCLAAANAKSRVAECWLMMPLPLTVLPDLPALVARPQASIAAIASSRMLATPARHRRLTVAPLHNGVCHSATHNCRVESNCSWSCGVINERRYQSVMRSGPRCNLTPAENDSTTPNYPTSLPKVAKRQLNECCSSHPGVVATLVTSFIFSVLTRTSYKTISADCFSL